MVAPRHSPKVGVVVIHPRVDFAHHYSIPRLVGAGFGVLAATTRHAGNDTLARVRGGGARRRRLRALPAREASASRRWCCSATAAAARSSRTTRRRRGCPRRRAHHAHARRCTDVLRRRADDARGRDRSMSRRIAGSARSCSTRSIRRSSTSAIRFRSIPSSTCTTRATDFASRPRGRSTTPAFLARYRAAQRARVERLDAYARERIAHAASRHRRQRFATPADDDAQSARRVYDPYGRLPHDGEPRVRRSQHRSERTATTARCSASAPI